MKNYFICLITGMTMHCSGLMAQSPGQTPNTLTLIHNYNHFDKQFSNDWNITSLEYKRETGIGAFLGRVNYGHRFNQSGWQWEAESYPKFSKKTYGYINIGYSSNMPVFPKFRSGASIYVNVPGGWELEGGFRQLYFDKMLWIGTGGVSKYAGRWLLNFKSFISPASASVDQSYFFTARLYFEEEKSFAWLQLGTGVSPDESQNIQLQNKQHLSSKKVNAGIHYTAGNRTILLFSIGYSRDEYLSGVFGNQVYGTAGLGFSF